MYIVVACKPLLDSNLFLPHKKEKAEKMLWAKPSSKDFQDAKLYRYLCEIIVMKIWGELQWKTATKESLLKYAYFSLC